MQVKTLRAHGNRCGDQYEKAIGDEYENPRPQALIDAGIVEIVADGKRGKDRGPARTGAGAGGAAKIDGAEHASEGAEKTS